MGCESCFRITLPQCPAQLVINAGLLDNQKYRWEITDKFDHVFNGLTQTDANGLLQINIQDDPDIPAGLFMHFSGAFVLRIFKWLTDYNVEDAHFTVNETDYDCAEMRFKEYKPAIAYFNSDDAIYIPPFIAPIEVAFVLQTSVNVIHDLGYKPFVQVFDDSIPANVIGCTVQHNSNNDFTVTFDIPTTGTISYR